MSKKFTEFFIFILACLNYEARVFNPFLQYCTVGIERVNTRKVYAICRLIMYTGKLLLN